MSEREPEGTRPAPDDDQLPFRYDARLAGKIEARWQERWEADGTFNSPNPSGRLSEGFAQVAGRRKFYVLDMFPYPSGAGLHVGHPLGYIGTDVYARYLRMFRSALMRPVEESRNGRIVLRNRRSCPQRDRARHREVVLLLGD